MDTEISQEEMLKRKVESYNLHTSVLKKADGEYAKALEAKSADDWDSFDFHLRGAEILIRRYELDRDMNYNNEYVKKFKEDIKYQEGLFKKKTEYMNANYKSLVEKARPLLEKKDITDKNKGLIRESIRRYEKGNRNFNDFALLLDATRSLGESKLKIVK